jgi:hypothetical protein
MASRGNKTGFSEHLRFFNSKKGKSRDQNQPIWLGPFRFTRIRLNKRFLCLKVAAWWPNGKALLSGEYLYSGDWQRLRGKLKHFLCSENYLLTLVQFESRLGRFFFAFSSTFPNINCGW